MSSAAGSIHQQINLTRAQKCHHGSCQQVKFGSPDFYCILFYLISYKEKSHQAERVLGRCLWGMAMLQVLPICIIRDQWRMMGFVGKNTQCILSWYKRGLDGRWQKGYKKGMPPSAIIPHLRLQDLKGKKIHTAFFILGYSFSGMCLNHWASVKSWVSSQWSHNSACVS